MAYRRIRAGLVLLALLVVCFSPVRLAAAQDASPSDLIAAVNALRASRGLAPYQVDAWLMGYAQEHSEYEASMGVCTHAREGNSGPVAAGVQENIACGNTGSITPDFAVYTVWTDEVHMQTMVGYPTGFIGAGIASGGGTTYYTINVRPGSSPPTATLRASTPAAVKTTTSPELVLAQITTQPAIQSVITATPRADGAVIHTVGYGQSLWNIAISYGVKIDEIRSLNGLPADSTAIREGQKLLIRAPSPFSPTPSLTPTAGEVPPSPTPTPSPEPSETPRPTKTPAPTSTPTSAPFSLESLLPDRQVIAYILIGICILGLGAVLLTSFKK